MSDYDTPPSMACPEPAPPPGWRSILTNALRYWEPRRLIYNGVLAIIVLLHWLDAKTASEVNYTHGHIMWLILLAVAANICYCAAYGVDILVQLSDFQKSWLQWRWALLVLGILIAAVAAHVICGPFFRIPA
jgi:hypothetical protein